MIRTLGQRSSPVVLRVYSRSLSSDAALVTPLCRGRAHSSAITTARALSSAITSSLSGSKGVSQPWRQQRRSLSTYRFMSGGRSGGLGQLDLWPVTQVNTFINVCHQVCCKDLEPSDFMDGRNWYDSNGILPSVGMVT